MAGVEGAGTARISWCHPTEGSRVSALGSSRASGVGRGFGELHLRAASALPCLLCGKELPALCVPKVAAGWGN